LLLSPLDALDLATHEVPLPIVMLLLKVNRPDP